MMTMIGKKHSNVVQWIDEARIIKETNEVIWRTNRETRMSTTILPLE